MSNSERIKYKKKSTDGKITVSNVLNSTVDIPLVNSLPSDDLISTVGIVREPNSAQHIDLSGIEVEYLHYRSTKYKTFNLGDLKTIIYSKDDTFLISVGDKYFDGPTLKGYEKDDLILRIVDESHIYLTTPRQSYRDTWDMYDLGKLDLRSAVIVTTVLNA
jgi:glucose/arabinose dehydrogenase